MEKIWLKQYPAGVPAEIDVDQYASLVALLDESFRRYADRMAYKFMGKSISFRAGRRGLARVRRLAAGAGLAKGDRVAVMMPNVPQYPVAVAAILRAGLVVVNVNPLYTPRELEHQLKDSGAKAIVILENFASVLQQVMSAVPTKKVVLASMGDMLGFPKSHDRQLRRAQGEEAGAGRSSCRAPCASTTRSPQGRGKTFKPAQRRPRRHRRAAVHRRHDRRQQGRGAAAPQPGRQHPAGRGLVPAGAEEDPERRADRDDLRAADLSHLRLQHEHDAVDAHGRRQHPDRQSARPARRLQGAAGREVPQLSGRQHALQRDGQPSGLRQRRLERAS